MRSRAARSTLSVRELHPRERQQWEALAHCPLAQRALMQSVKEGVRPPLVVAGCELNPIQQAAAQEALTEIEQLTQGFGKLHSERSGNIQQVRQAVGSLPHGELLVDSLDQGMDLGTLKHVLCKNFGEQTSTSVCWLDADGTA